MRLLEYENKLYEIVFLNTDPALSEDDRVGICMSAIEMSVKKQRTRKIKGEGYEGRMKTDGKYYQMGTFGGRRFEARVETNHGKRDIGVLLTRKIDPSLN